MDDSARAMQVLAQLPVSLVRLRQSALREMTNARLVALVGAVRRVRGRPDCHRPEDPQAIGRVWGCGVDFIQGNYIQPASEGFDFDFVRVRAGLIRPWPPRHVSDAIPVPATRGLW